MAQQSDTGTPCAALAPHALSPEVHSDGTLENLSIFSAPALEIVSRWWLDSNRRWTGRNDSPSGTGVPEPRESVVRWSSPSLDHQAHPHQPEGYFSGS